MPSTPFTETGENGNIMVVAATINSAKGNKCFYGGTVCADSRRDL